MSDKQNPQEPTHEHEGFLERILHHHHQNEEAQYQKEPDQDKAGKDDHGDHDEHHKKKGESELDKMKDYLHEDEELEAEGRTYGGLM